MSAAGRKRLTDAVDPLGKRKRQMLRLLSDDSDNDATTKNNAAYVTRMLTVRFTAS